LYKLCCVSREDEEAAEKAGKRVGDGEETPAQRLAAIRAAEDEAVAKSVELIREEKKYKRLVNYFGLFVLCAASFIWGYFA